MPEQIQQSPDHDDHVGLRCRRCGHPELRVVYTRRRLGGTVARRRECDRCGTRVSTVERAIGA